MLFQVYGDTAFYQWIGWAIVFLALIGLNEVARRSKIGGITCFFLMMKSLLEQLVFFFIKIAGISGEYVFCRHTAENTSVLFW